MPFRLAPDQMRRLERAAHSLRKTKQSFVQEIVLERIAEVEEHHKIRKGAPVGSSAPPIGSTGDDKDMGSGLGITASLKITQQPKERDEVLSAPPPPVVVQVGGGENVSSTPSAKLSDLDRLAIYVVKGDEFLRDMRKRTALEILRASSSTDEEYNVLVAQLEQVIAIKTKVAAENTPVNKLARIAFDKLTTLLRGD